MTVATEIAMSWTAVSPLQDVWSIVLSKVGTGAEAVLPHARARARRNGQLIAEPTAIPDHLSARQAHVIVKMGIPSRSLAPLTAHLGIGKGAVAGVLGLDRATATRKVAKDDVLPDHAAESMLRLLELDTLARDTFETPEEAAGWLRRPHPMLDGEAPLDCAKSSFGAERVRDILAAVKYGGVV